MTDLHKRSLGELAGGLAAGDFSSVELTQALLDRIGAHGATHNAFFTVTGEASLAAAARAEVSRAAGEAGALNGRPIVHKDINCTEGEKTTCVSKMLDNFV